MKEKGANIRNKIKWEIGERKRREREGERREKEMGREKEKGEIIYVDREGEESRAVECREN